MVEWINRAGRKRPVLNLRHMQRYSRRNHAFDRIGDSYGSVIDHDHFLGRSAFDIPRKKRYGMPPANVRKEGPLLVLELAIPGFSKEELDISVDHGYLKIKGERRSEEKKETASLIVEEFEVNSFERSFRLAREIMREEIIAKYEDGILRITFIDVPAEQERDRRVVPVQ